MEALSGGQYRPLAEGEIARIHETALGLLEETGISVGLEEAREIFRRHGARIDGERVRIPPAVAEKALALAPRQFLMAGREERHDLRPGDRRVCMGTGGAALTVLDPETGRARPGTLRDVASIARLCDALENVHFYLRPCIPRDIPPEAMDVNQFYAALSNTTKPVMAAAQSPENVRAIVEMAAMIAGGHEALIRRPLISFVTSWMISPLHFATETTRVLLEAAANGIPVALSAAPMAGSTSPVTLAGTLAQVHAEQISGICLTQLAHPGAPVLYGAIPSMADLKWMTYIGGGAEFGLMNAAASQMAQHLHIPNYNSAGLTDAKIPDIQAGWEKAFSLCLCALAGSNFIHHAAGMLESMKAVAYEQYVIDDEIIGMALRLLRGIRVDEETLATDAIREAGPAGNYLTSPHTVRFMRREYFRPRVADRRNREAWEADGSPDARERARRIAKQILQDHCPLPIDPAVDREIRRRFDILLPPLSGGEAAK